MRRCAAVLFCLLALATAAAADTVATLGAGRLFTNDYLGDGHDRWQSGSYVISVLRGPSGVDPTAQPFGTIREYRWRSAVISSDGRGAAPGDRPYVGTLSFGAHSHFGAGTTRARVGVDVTATGPQTGVSRFQREAHNVLGLRQVRFTDQQFRNDTFWGISSEAAEVIALSDRATLRPFGEVHSGPEDLIRVGADAFLGRSISDDLLIRDVTTGHLYTGTPPDAGALIVFGADVARVADSVYLDDSITRQSRGRLRAGVHLQDRQNRSVFYGLTYLTPEFDGQDEGQITGSVKLNFNF